MRDERPDWVLVFGDTNSTLAGARAAGDVRIAHVEAGLRSFDLSMPEERNRIEVDRLAALLLCPDERSAAQLTSEGVPGQTDVVGDVMADATRIFAPIARTHTVSRDGDYTALTIHRQANTEPGRLREIAAALAAAGRRFVFPVHPRTRHALAANGIALPSNVEAIEPLGYLEMLALVEGADIVVTDSGGLQKESYWLRRPLRHAASEHGVGGHRRGRCKRAHGAGRSRAGAGCSAVSGPGAAAVRRRTRRRTHHSSPVLLSRLSTTPLYDVAVIGAGYVGVPLAVTFGEAGQRALVVDVSADVIEALNRGESHIEDVSDERLAPLVEQRPLRRNDRLRPGEAGSRDLDRGGHAALQAA